MPKIQIYCLLNKIIRRWFRTCKILSPQSLCRKINLERQNISVTISSQLTQQTLPHLQTTYLHIIVNMVKILQIPTNILSNIFESFKIKMPTLQQQKFEVLQTHRSKIDACFSRRWRQTQYTIYLLVHIFMTPQKSNKIRVFIINQRGLILQVHSNLQPHKWYIAIAKNIKNSYSRLKNVIIVSPSQQFMDIDSMSTFQNILNSVRITMIAYQIKANLSAQLTQILCSQCQFFKSKAHGIFLTIFSSLGLVVIQNQLMPLQFLDNVLSHLNTILSRQEKVKHFFKAYNYQSHHFNQKQFLLRLYSFNFNFITLESMDSKEESSIKESAIRTCSKEFLDRKLDLQLKSGEKDVHCFTTNPTNLICPVCKKKSKVICMKCSAQFGTKFALCEMTCFQKFHQDRIKYAHEISSQRKVNDFSIQSKSQMFDVDEESPEDPHSNPHNSPTQTKNIKELREKWRKTIQNENTDLDYFIKMSSMNFIPPNLVNRMNLLGLKISKFSECVLEAEKQKLIKQQQVSSR